jgi:hypothetical protein
MYEMGKTNEPVPNVTKPPIVSKNYLWVNWGIQGKYLLRYPECFDKSNDDLFNKNTLGGKLFVSCLLFWVAIA